MQQLTKSTTNLKLAIPRGGIEAIARAAGVTRSTASKVLRGKSTNRQVIKATAEYMAELQRDQEIIQRSALQMIN